jgi:hypothetical protein
METFKSEDERKPIWERVKSWTRVAGLVAMMSVLGTESALAGETKEETPKQKDHIEQLKSDITEQEQIIKKIVEEKGDFTYDKTRKELKGSHGETVAIHYQDNGQTIFYLRGKDNVIEYVDRGVEGGGFADRVIIEKYEDGQEQKEALVPHGRILGESFVNRFKEGFTHNDIGFDDLENLAASVHTQKGDRTLGSQVFDNDNELLGKMVEDTLTSPRNNAYVIGIGPNYKYEGSVNENGVNTGHVIKVVDLATGTREEVEGGDVNDAVEKIQEGFLKGLKDFEK